jgi:hypothetical protein
MGDTYTAVQCHVMLYHMPVSVLVDFNLIGGIIMPIPVSDAQCI